MTISWGTLAQNVYYIGVGCLLIATSIRFTYRFIRDIEKKHDFVDTMEHEWPKLKKTVLRIAHKLNVPVADPEDEL